jgi:hypothetical protein
MVGRFLLPVLLLGCVAFAHAETYKWVDDKGVTNYSNNPPPASKAANAVQQVEERLSYYEPDPGLKAAASRPFRPSLSEAEWLQRQQLMAMRLAYPPCARSGCADPYSDVYYPVYPVAVGVRHASFRSRPFTNGRHASHIHSGGTGGRRGAPLR